MKNCRFIVAIAGAACALTMNSAAYALPLVDTDGGGAGGAGAYDVSQPQRVNFALDLRGGLYVIGDSLSTTPQQVPYIDVLNHSPAVANKNVAIRAKGGTGVGDHLHRYGWTSNGYTTSATDAVATKAGTVYIELGTNDMSCTHVSQFMPGWSSDPAKNKVDGASKLCDWYANYANRPNEGSDPTGYSAWRGRLRDKILGQVVSLIAKLRADGANRCIAWAGPREVDLYGAKVEDNKWFNDQLRAIGAANSWFHYVNFDYYSRTDPSLSADFYGPNGPDVHPRTTASSTSMAKLAIFASAAPPATPKPGEPINPLLPTGGCGPK